MLQITDTAAQQLGTALLEREEGGAECFRLVVTDTGVQLRFGEQDPADVTFKHGDRVVLTVDSDTAELLKDRKIDYDEEASALVFL